MEEFRDSLPADRNMGTRSGPNEAWPERLGLLIHEKMALGMKMKG